MIMIETRNKISEAVKCELANCDSYGQLYNTNHEAYAIIKEEVEEVEKELQSVQTALLNAWNSIKNDDTEKLEEAIDCLDDFAFWLIGEAVQVRACVKKWQRGTEVES